MGKPTAVEIETLAEAEVLLRFAAEHVKELPPAFAQTFAEARAAAAQDNWTPDNSKNFWDAFARLCDLIQPVNTDCLSTAQAKVSPSSWWGLRRNRPQVLLAERSSSRYLFALLSLLFVLIAIQLYVWMSTSLSKRIDELFTANLSLASRLALVDYKKLDSTPDAAGHSLTRVEVDLDSLNAEVERIRLEVGLLDRITALFIFSQVLDGTEESEPPSKAAVDPSGKSKEVLEKEFQSTRRRLAEVRHLALHVQEKAYLIVGTLASFILPVLFGTIGALAYVIRTISDQIRRSTFGQSSPIRHLMRVALGALAGVVIGLFNTGLSAQLSLSPLALAFLAGYGVEAVFSLFDMLVDKFKQPPPTQIEAKK